MGGKGDSRIVATLNAVSQTTGARFNEDESKVIAVLATRSHDLRWNPADRLQRPTTALIT